MRAPEGPVYEFVTEVRAGDELVWEETSAYLRRGKGDDAAAYGTAFPEAPPTGTSGSCRPTSAAATPRSRATPTRSTSTR